LIAAIGKPVETVRVAIACDIQFFIIEKNDILKMGLKVSKFLKINIMKKLT